MVLDRSAQLFLRESPRAEHRELALGGGGLRLAHVRFERSLLWPRRWIPLTPRGETCLELFGEMSRDKYRLDDAQRAALAGASALSVPPPFVLGGSANYWHFAMDYLPRLLLLRLAPELAPRPLLIPADLPGPFRELLQAVLVRLGCTPGTTVPCGPEFVVLHDAVFPTKVSRAAAVWAWEEGFPPAHAAEAPAPERIFVRRDHASHRLLANQDELAERLRREGFHCVDPGGLPVAEQMALFRAARLVVGVHGAGLTNLLFAPRGCRVLELFAAAPQGFYADLCRRKGHALMRLRGSTLADGSRHGFRVAAGDMLDALRALRAQ